MIDGLYQTKLFIPTSGRNWVARPRLLAKLDGGLPCKMVLVSAPAGYGKTTLITAWLETVKAEGHAICWVALDEEDSDPQRFFRYLAAAIEPLPGAQTGLSQLLQSDQLPPAKGLIQRLIGDLATVSANFFLVLDDYHRLDSAEIDMALSTLLDYMPSQMTLVMTSRSDPGFPISRLRARREIVEIRAEALRFTPEEAARFFEQTMSLTLDSSQTTLLGEKTEGWIAGLQMAALSLQNRRDGAAEFVNQFSGSHRFILDFLAEEVLLGLSEDLRDFLLSTSILERLGEGICNAITGRDDAQQLLEELEHSNLFVIQLDHERRWYRYHHLFADVLRVYAQKTRPEGVVNDHQRASRWLMQNGSPAEAIRHAFAAADFELAASQIELIWRSMDRSFQDAAWLRWVEALPQALIETRPVLCAGYAWALIGTGQIDAAEPLLALAERWLEAPSAEMVVVDQKEFEALPATIAAARAYIAQAAGDWQATVKYAQLTLDLLAKDDHFYRGIPSITLALAQMANGELAAAFQYANDALTSFKIAKNEIFVFGGHIVMAEIKVAQGDLLEARHIYKQALTQLAEPAGSLLGTSANMHRGLAVIYCEQGDLEAAGNYLTQSLELFQPAEGARAGSQQLVAQAKLKRAEGKLEEAIDLLDRAQAVYRRGWLPNLEPIDALKSRMLITLGQLPEAELWADRLSLGGEDELHYLSEYTYLTLVRFWLARYQQAGDPSDWKNARQLLARLLPVAQNGGRTGRVSEILLLQAIADSTLESDRAWESSLRQALTLARPQGYVRLFANEGPPLLRLLQQIKPDGPDQKAYCETLIRAFPGESTAGVKGQPLVDPLSERELEILRLVAAGLKNKEVADQLFISLNTVLYHTKNIYGKLGVNKRTLAIAKARALEII